MEDNHCVILDKCPSNQLIAKIQMTRNIMFPLTLKPSMKKNTTQFVYDTKDEELETAFKEQSEEKKIQWSIDANNIPICEGCIFGKQHRELFPVGKSY
jgi:hypothetical protein